MLLAANSEAAASGKRTPTAARILCSSTGAHKYATPVELGQSSQQPVVSSQESAVSRQELGSSTATRCIFGRARHCITLLGPLIDSGAECDPQHCLLIPQHRLPTAAF